jgi:ATP-dependent RNA helicase RhlE
MTFAELQLDSLLQRAVADEGYTVPTPIQLAAIPPILAGKDLLGCAQTGTGKTAAFALPILHRLMREPAPAPQQRRPIRTLILAPTRELAGQIFESFQNYGRHTRLRYAVIFGGVNQNPQVASLKAGVDVLIATPGRLLDLMGQGFVDLRSLHHFVLDEADNMLDMGFIHDIRRIIPHIPSQRQTLLFSATMPPEIRTLADTILHEPVSVKVAPISSAAETVDQAVYFVEKADKPRLLAHYLNHSNTERVLVFTRTKHGADRVAKHLMREGIQALAIHGNKSMNARKRAMSHFKGDAPPVLVATDIAARGLDIDDVSHVINFDLPNVPETYIHRIGRTGRAGASGLAVSFCDREERAFLRSIERLMRREVPVVELPAALPAARPGQSFHAPAPADKRPLPSHQAASATQCEPRPFHPAPQRHPKQGASLARHQPAQSAQRGHKQPGRAPHAPSLHTGPQGAGQRRQAPRTAHPQHAQPAQRQHPLGGAQGGGHPSQGKARQVPAHHREHPQRTSQHASPGQQVRGGRPHRVGQGAGAGHPRSTRSRTGDVRHRY